MIWRNDYLITTFLLFYLCGLGFALFSQHLRNRDLVLLSALCFVLSFAAIAMLALFTPSDPKVKETT